MKLITSPTSPFVRKVRVLIREANLTDAVEEIPVATTPMAPDPQAVAANPLGKIPALIRSDAPTIFDSRVICRYLDDHAGSDFYPASRLWEVLTLEALADGLMEAAIAMAYETRLRPEGQRSPDWIEAQWKKVDRGLTAIDTNWMSHLAGPLTAAQIAVGCALSYVDFRHDSRNWREGRAALSDWDAAFSQRPSMQTTVPA